MYKIRTETSGFTLVNDETGNLARNTSSEVYVAQTEADAAEARDYLNAGKPRSGSHRMKSTFGVSLAP